MNIATPIKPYPGNWCDAGQYPEFGSKDYERLAWEFIRRNREYAKLMTVFSRLSKEEYQDGIKKDSDTCLDELECVPKAKAGETAREYHARMKKSNKKGRILRPQSILKSRWYMEPPKLLLPDEPYDLLKTNFVTHVVARRIKSV
jgi:hypothetical protein